jgi:hypothetical protein
VTCLNSQSGAIQNHREVRSVTGKGKKENKLQMTITETKHEDDCDSSRKACVLETGMMDIRNSSTGIELE